MKKQFKISYKIITAIVICSIVISSIIGYVSITRGSKVIKSNAEKKLQLKAEKQANHFTAIMSRVEDNIKGLDATIKATFDVKKNSNQYLNNYKETINPLLEEFNKMNEGAINTFFYVDSKVFGEPHKFNYSILSDEGSGGEKNEQIASEEKVDTSSSATIANSRNNIEVETTTQLESLPPWIKNVKNQKEGSWSRVYFDQDISGKMISFRKPVYIDDELIGVVGADLAFTGFEKMIESISTYKTSYAFLLNDKLDFLVHPDYNSSKNLNTVNNSYYKKVADDLKRNNSGVFNYKAENGTDKILAFARLANNNIIGVTAEKSEVLAEMDSLQQHVILLVIVGALISIIVALFIGKKIARPIEEAVIFSNELATGNLSIEPLRKSNRDETGDLAKSLNTMHENFIELIGEVKKSAEHVSSSSQQVLASSEDIGNISEEVSYSTQKLAVGAEEQTKDIIKVTEQMGILSKKIEELDEANKETNQLADKMNVVAENGQSKVNNIFNQMNNIGDSIANVAKDLNNLKEITAEIDAILDIINNIAKQTNLLALNAAIEAARAGESGQGFNVVAEEIRQLAEESANSAEQIRELLDEIQRETHIANKKMHDTTKEIKNGEIIVEEAKEGFEKIEKVVKSVNEGINFSTNAAKEVVTQNEQNVSLIRNVADTIKESSNSTEKVAASTQEQTASVEELVSLADSLSNTAIDLEKLVNEFKL